MYYQSKSSTINKREKYLSFYDKLQIKNIQFHTKIIHSNNACEESGNVFRELSNTFWTSFIPFKLSSIHNTYFNQDK